MESNKRSLDQTESEENEVKRREVSSKNDSNSQLKGTAFGSIDTINKIIQFQIAAGHISGDAVDALKIEKVVNNARIPLSQNYIPIESVEEEQEYVSEEDFRLERIKQLLSRPARVQVKDYNNSSYIEGNQTYNIWYNKWSGERNNDYINGRTSLAPAMYCCDPDTDSGYTRANAKHSVDDAGTKFICLFFAKGCCSQGKNCNYLHRVPILEDEYFLDTSVDIFGRERFSKHRDDMTGVGSFNSSCKVLFIGDLSADVSASNPVEDLKIELTKKIEKYVPLQEINVIINKGVAFATFESRVYAEFVKVALGSQPMGVYSTALNVKWAHDIQKTQKKEKKDVKNFGDMVRKHEEQLRKFQEDYLSDPNFVTNLINKHSGNTEVGKKDNAEKKKERMKKILGSVAGLKDDQFDVEI
ncbi:pre-mRNA splicing complex subunit [Theileria orientalis]|uniref:Pre-mRNA splicing complex subunit n=1 Tax=Theileria orientalis TaxID=68886 RepID=A0A976MDM5_THEOR|nr:pre-mRNA splicing complex subunit [Theileria orientalis]